MIPDTATIIKRRHLATSIVRVGLAIWGAWLLVRTTDAVFDMVEAIALGRGTIGIGTVLYPVLPFVPWVIALAMHRPLVKWIVPPGERADLCPGCGYSLKNLNSPICPECGLTLRSAPAQAAAAKTPAR